MSEMTAIRLAILGTLAAVWLALAALLWRTSVPALDEPPLDAAALFDERTVARNARYEYVLTTVWALGLLALLVALAVAARRAPRPRMPALLSGALLGLWAAFVGLAVAYVLLYPKLLAPRLEPLDDRALAAEIETLGRRLGLEQTVVEVREARERTRAVNAEALGAGPTTR